MTDRWIEIDEIDVDAFGLPEDPSDEEMAEVRERVADRLRVTPGLPPEEARGVLKAAIAEESACWRRVRELEEDLRQARREHTAAEGRLKAAALEAYRSSQRASVRLA